MPESSLALLDSKSLGPVGSRLLSVRADNCPYLMGASLVPTALRAQRGCAQVQGWEVLQEPEERARGGPWYLCDLHPQAVVFRLQALQAGRAGLVHAGDRGGCFGIFFPLVLSELESPVLSGCIWVGSQSDELKGQWRT